MNLGHISSTSAPFVKVDSSICFFYLFVCFDMNAMYCILKGFSLYSFGNKFVFIVIVIVINGFITQVRCINPLFALKSRCRGSIVAAAPGLSYRQLPAASAVTGLVVQYLAVFNVVSNFCHWCYCHFTIVQHVLCYLAHVDFLMMPDKTVKSNQSITSYHKHINFLCYIQQNWMKWYIFFMCSEAFIAMCINFADYFITGTVSYYRDMVT